MVTFTTTVSRLVTEPRPWVTGCLSGTEHGSASIEAMARSFTLSRLAKERAAGNGARS